MGARHSGILQERRSNLVVQIGQVAQLVEQRTENPRVGGSIPPLATIFSTTCIASEILAKALAGVLRELN